MSPGDPFSAGNIVATPRDMLLLLEGVFNGQLVGGAALERMTTELYPMFDPGLYYGLGIMIYELPDDTWAGHSGGTPGAKAIVAYSIENGVYAAVALTGEGSAESIARVFVNLLSDAKQL
jgi:D-alanyl-D-alanine carboxypeptidase